MFVYKDCTPGHRCTLVFAGYKEGYLCLKSTSVVVNFCWSEFSTVSG